MTARPSKQRHDDTGSAVVEFVVLGVLLLVPVVYLVVTLASLQAASFATDGGARAAARAFVTADDERAGRAAAADAVRLALLDHRLPVDDDALAVECTQQPCLTPDGRVVVTVEVDVVLPGVPAAFDAVVPTHVTVRSTHVAAVDAFRAVAP